jgi:WD40 repeat protein
MLHYATAESDYLIKIWNLETNCLLNSLEGHTDKVFKLIYLNKSHITSASRDHTIKIWNYESTALLQTLVSDFTK